mmetsp:Transcript_27053/g.80228  ORF Transcript_27053/g.80228 Transcript_27053/m.80228 type:complete len:896 (-) Transcript_27053:1061-3748(-)
MPDASRSSHGMVAAGDGAARAGLQKAPGKSPDCVAGRHYRQKRGLLADAASYLLLVISTRMMLWSVVHDSLRVGREMLVAKASEFVLKQRCHAWAHNPIAAVLRASLLQSCNVILLVVLANFIAVLVFRNRFGNFWRIVGCVVMRLFLRILGLVQLVAWYNGINIVVHGSTTWLTHTGHLLVGAILGIAACLPQVMSPKVSRRVHIAIQTVEFICNSLMLHWLICFHGNVEPRRSVAMFLVATAVSIVIPIALAASSQLLSGVQHDQSNVHADPSARDAMSEPARSVAVPVTAEAARLLDTASACSREVVAALDALPVVSYTSQYRPTVRISIKVMGHEPEDLVPGWRAQLLTHLEDGGRVRSLAVRRGCTQLVLDMDEDNAHGLLALLQEGGTQNQDSSSSRLDQLGSIIADSTALMRANGNLNEVLPSLFRSVGSGSMSATVQLSSDPGMSTQTHRDSRELPAVLSASPSVTELPMMRNAMVEAALTLSAPLPLGCKLVARHCTSGFLAVVSAEVTHNIIRTCFAAPQQPGRVHFEVVDNDTGVLGMAAAMLLLPTGAATVELLLVQNSKLGLQTSAMQPSRSHPFATDLGMWIDTMLMDSSGTMNEGHRQEAERIGHAMLEFCASNHLNAIHDMLVSFKQSVYSRQHESSSAQASSAKQHVLTEDLPGLCHRRVATGAIHSELRHNTVNQGAVLPVRPTSLLHGSRIRWTLCNLVIILCAFSIKSPGMISCVGAMLHASDILLLFMAALRAIAWQQLACVLDSVERNIRPCYGLLVLLNRTIFCFAGAAGLVGVHSAVPELPPLGLVAMMPVMDLSFVFIQSPIRPLGRAIAAALVHGVAFFCMVQSYSDPSAFSAAVLVTVMVVAVHMLPERWIAPHIGPAGAHRAAPRVK